MIPATAAIPRREIGLILLACFGVFTLLSVWVVFSAERTLHFADASTALTIGFQVVVGAGVLAYLRRKGRDLRAFRVRVSWDSIVIGLLLGIVMLGVTYAVHAIVFVFVPGAAEYGPIDYRDATTGWLMLLFIVVNSWFEESFAVAYIVSAFAGAGAARVIFASAALRTVYHLYQGPLGAAAVLMMGVVFAATYYRTRDLSILIVAHTTMNILILFWSR